MHSLAGKVSEAARQMVETVIARAPAFAVGVIIFIVFYVLSRILAGMMRRALAKRRHNLGVVLGRLTQGATMMLGVLVAFSIVAPSFQAADLIKILGIGGVAIGFAFQNILQNFLAGLLLLLTEPFRVGDEIKLDAFEGTVEEIQTRATIIKTYDQRRVVIPNADLFTHPVIVNTALGMRRWEYDLAAKNSQTLGVLKSSIANAVRAVEGVLADPAPEALVVDVGADTVKIRVLWWTRDAHQHQMLSSYDRVLTAIKEALDKFQGETNRSRAA